MEHGLPDARRPFPRRRSRRQLVGWGRLQQLVALESGGHTGAEAGKFRVSRSPDAAVRSVRLDRTGPPSAPDDGDPPPPWTLRMSHHPVGIPPDPVPRAGPEIPRHHHRLVARCWRLLAPDQCAPTRGSRVHSSPSPVSLASRQTGPAGLAGRGAGRRGTGHRHGPAVPMWFDWPRPHSRVPRRTQPAHPPRTGPDRARHLRADAIPRPLRLGGTLRPIAGLHRLQRRTCG